MQEYSTLFRWDTARYSWSDAGAFDGGPSWVLGMANRMSGGLSSCPLCQERISGPIRSGGGGYSEENGRCYAERLRYLCPLCGWSFEQEDIDDWAGYVHFSATYLRDFDTDNAELAARDVERYLERHVSDTYSLPLTQIEALIRDIFREHGFYSQLAQQTTDGGASILLLAHTETRVGQMIECRKVREERKLEIGAIRELIGAAVSWETRRGCLVSSTDLSRPIPSADDFYSAGVEIDLVALSEFLKLLGVYGFGLPPLHRLTEETRRSIVEQNIAAAGLD
jgi:hypothetical protein